MDKLHLKHIFTDENLFKELKSAQNEEAAQNLLSEKNINLSVDELINFLLQHKDKNVLNDEEMKIASEEGILWSEIAVKYLDAEKQIIDTYGIEKYLEKTEL